MTGLMKKAVIYGIVVLLVSVSGAGYGLAASGENVSVEDVLNMVHARYGKSAFCANFGQISTLTGMGIQDTAEGSACFKHPDKMRWHYRSPEEQFIVSDGETLWVYRPVDNQVMVGKAKEFFGAGEGASFFTDVAMLKKGFDVDWAEQNWQEEAKSQNAWALRLVPKNVRPEFVSLCLLIDKDSHEIFEAISYNNFGDETRMRFSRPDFDKPVPEAQFTFGIPPGVDVVEFSSQGD